MISTGFILSTAFLARYSHIVKTRGGMPVQTAALLIGLSLVGLAVAAAGILGRAG